MIEVTGTATYIAVVIQEIPDQAFFVLPVKEGIQAPNDMDSGHRGNGEFIRDYLAVLIISPPYPPGESEPPHTPPHPRLDKDCG